jgi:hypothetical protein
MVTGSFSRFKDPDGTPRFLIYKHMCTNIVYAYRSIFKSTNIIIDVRVNVHINVRVNVLTFIKDNVHCSHVFLVLKREDSIKKDRRRRSRSQLIGGRSTGSISDIHSGGSVSDRCGALLYNLIKISDNIHAYV